MFNQDPENQKNLLLAIVLSVGVLLAWQFFYAAPKLKEEQERQARIRQEQQAQFPQQVTPGAPSTPIAQPGGSTPQAAVPGPTAANTAANREAALQASPRVAIETPSIKGSISLKGGRIDDVVLPKYRETVDPHSPPVVLFSPSGAPHPYYAEYGWVAGTGVTQPMPDANTLWKAEGPGPLAPASPVKLLWDNGQGLIFHRTISVDDNYLFTVADEVENKTGSAVSLYPFALISRHGMPKVDGFYILHEGPIGVLGSALQEISYADLLKEGPAKSFKQTGGWLGFTDKYWAAALIPDQKTATDARFTGVKGTKDTFQADFASGPVTIAPGAKQGFSSHLFAGAKVVSLIDAYGEQLQADRFDRLVDWGWFHFITKPLYKLLHWLGQLFGNYGLAILATTVLVKLLFFPLANKSYESMAKMKMLQPEMEKLRERYKDDRTKQQQELMQLYRDKKINPMAGCLPILLQIPVFFALYKVLFITIDMRHAPFFGWIKDLSAPDPTSIFNLFGLLPFATPEFLHVGVWPIVMGITMWFQMQLNPQQPDPIQQKIFNWMPVMFTFLLASFSVGLVIYWAWNNVLSLLQQYTIMRKNGAEIHLWKNMGIDKLIARVRSGQALSFAGATSGGGSSSGPANGGGGSNVASASNSMTRDQALDVLGLKPGATANEIDAAYKKRTGQKGSLNGSEKLNQARDILQGKEGV